MNRVLIAKYQDAKISIDNMISQNSGVTKRALKDMRKRLVEARSTLGEYQFAETLKVIRKALKDFQDTTKQ